MSSATPRNLIVRTPFVGPTSSMSAGIRPDVSGFIWIDTVLADKADDRLRLFLRDQVVGRLEQEHVLVLNLQQILELAQL